MVFSTPNLLVPVLSALKLHTNLNLIIKKKQEKNWDSYRKNDKKQLTYKVIYYLSHNLHPRYK